MVLSAILGAALFTSVQLAGTLLLPYAINSMRWLVLLLGALMAIWSFANVVLTAFTSGSFAFVIVDNLEKRRPDIFESNFKSDSRDRLPSVLAIRRLTARQLILLLTTGIVIAGLVGAWLMNGIQANDDIAVIAHRGAAGSAPENTLASVRQAIADKTDWIEIDVQETADGEVIVVHDSDFMKLAGIDLKVWNGTLEQVRALDVGSWFGSEYADERVPTLFEVLNEARGMSGVIIELKYYGHDQNLEQRVVEIVERAGMVDDVMIMSLAYQGIQKIRALRPDWPIGLLAAQAVGDLTQLDADFLAVNSSLATPKFIRNSRAARKQVFVWTVNDAVNMSRMMSLGVDGIITDEPGLAREVLVERSDMNTAERLLVHTALLLGQQLPSREYRDKSP